MLARLQLGVERRSAPVRSAQVREQTGSVFQSSAKDIEHLWQLVRSDLKIIVPERKLELERHHVLNSEVMPISRRRLGPHLERSINSKIRLRYAFEGAKTAVGPSLSF